MPQSPIWTPQPTFGTGAPSGTPAFPTALTAGKQYYDTSTTPYTQYVYHSGAWHEVGAPGGSPANSQSQVTAPVAPSSTSAFQMQGLAGSITPSASGLVLVTISGTIISTAGTAADGVEYQLSMGTGAAPGNNTTLAGTQEGSIQKYTIPATATAADVNVPFSITASFAATVGVANWIDLAAEALGAASVVGFANVNIVAVEQG